MPEMRAVFNMGPNNHLVILGWHDSSRVTVEMRVWVPDGGTRGYTRIVSEPLDPVVALLIAEELCHAAGYEMDVHENSES